METIEEGLRQRQFGPIVRLVVDEAMSESMVNLLLQNLDASLEDVYRLRPPLGMGGLWSLARLNHPELHDAPFTPAVPPSLPISRAPTTCSQRSASRTSCCTIHTIPFARCSTSSKPPRSINVLAIKQTLYRVGQTPVVSALLDAQRNGKQVAVLVESKAA